MKKFLKQGISIVLSVLLVLSVSAGALAATANMLKLTWPAEWQEGQPPTWALNATEKEINDTISAINKEYLAQARQSYDLGTTTGISGWGNMVGVQFEGGSNVGNPWNQEGRKWAIITAPFAGMAFSVKSYQAKNFKSVGAALSNEITWTNPTGGTNIYQMFTGGENLLTTSGAEYGQWGYTVGSTVSGKAKNAMQYAYALSAWNGMNPGCTHSDAKITDDGIVYQEFFGNDSTGASAQSDRGLTKKYGITYIVAENANSENAYVVSGDMFTAWASLWGNLNSNQPDRFSLTGAPVGNSYTAGEETRQDFEKVTLSINTANPAEVTVLDRDNSLDDFAIDSATVFSEGNTIYCILPAGTSLAALAPQFTIADTATVDKASGAAQNFSSDVQYTVTSESGEKAVYTIKASVYNEPDAAQKSAVEKLAVDAEKLGTTITTGDQALVDSMLSAYSAFTPEQMKLAIDNGSREKISAAQTAIDALKIKTQHVVFVGDSITAPTEGYTAITAGMFDSDEYSFMNAGISGFCLSPASDNPYTNTAQYTNGKNFEPNIVFIMLGTNDSKPRNWTDRGVSARFEQDLTDLVNIYRNLPSAPEVIIATSPTVYMDKGLVDTIDNDTVDKIVAIQKKVAAELDCPLLDINAYTKNQTTWFNDNDGVHPNATGHAAIATQFAAVITELEGTALSGFSISNSGVLGDVSGTFTEGKNEYTYHVNSIADNSEDYIGTLSFTSDNRVRTESSVVSASPTAVTMLFKSISVTGYTSTSYYVTFTTKALVKPGDVDGDGNVTVSDVVSLRKLIMSGNHTEAELAAGDLDNNSALTVSDVVALRSQIMTG